jgi:hypothetical protein
LWSVFSLQIARNKAPSWESASQCINLNKVVLILYDKSNDVYCISWEQQSANGLRVENKWMSGVMVTQMRRAVQNADIMTEAPMALWQVYCRRLYRCTLKCLKILRTHLHNLRVWRLNIRVYPKVSGLATWSENCEWYSSLPLGAVLSLFCESV